MKQRYGIIEAVEDAAELGYSVGAFGVKYFYQVSSAEALKNSMDSFIAERFEQRLHYFTEEHKKLSDQEKKTFYDDLNSNKKNLNYLYEFIEKLRVSTYDLQAKILARLSVDFIRKQELDYFANIILINIAGFSDNDLMNIFQQLKDNYELIDNKKRFTYKVSNDQDYLSYRKGVQIGLYYEPDDGISFATMEMGFKSGEKTISNKKVESNDLTKYFYTVLNDIIE